MSDKPTPLREQLIRNIHDAARERQQREPLYDSVCGSVTQGTAAKQLGAGIDEVAPGKRSCPYHYHLVEEEMFIVLEGSGTLRVAGEMLPVHAGDLIVIPAGPAYPHQLINTSDAVLKYLSISTQSPTEICFYPDSGKVGAYGLGVKLMQRPQDKLDYWDGEP